MEINEKRLLRVPEVARLLGISTGRCYELIRMDIIPIVRLGRQLRVDTLSLDNFIKGGGKALPGGWKNNA